MTRVNVGLCVKNAQKELNIPNERMARDFNVHHQQVSRWRVNSDMHLSKLQMFAEYFEMDLYEFLKLGEESNG